MIKVTVNKAHAGPCSYLPILTAGMAKAETVQFVFSADWDSINKTAVFTDGANTVDVLESRWTDNTVEIPAEVLTTAGRTIKVGIYGTTADGMTLPTIWAELGKVRPGADPSGDEATAPTLPVWAQLQALIGDLDDLTTTAKENLVAAINEAAKSGGGGGGTSADLSIRVSDGKIQWTKDGATWTDLVALSELKGTDGHTPEITAVKTDKTTTISVDGKAIATIKDGENGTDGDDGFSPTATVSKSGTVTTVKITDKSGTTTAEIKDGEPGTDGHTPEITATKSGKSTTLYADGKQIAEVKDGEDGTPGTDGTSVSISKISESTEDGGANVVTFNDGKTLSVKNGSKGSPGDDGFSPSAKVTKTDTGVKITITDKDGTTEEVVDTSGGTAEVTKQSVIDALGYTPAAIGNPEDWALVQTTTVTDATVKNYQFKFTDVMEHIIIMGSQPSDQTSNLGVSSYVVTDVDGLSMGLPYLSYMIDLPTYTKPAYTHIWCENGMVNAQHVRFAQNGNSISTHWDWCDKEHLDTRVRGFKSCSCYRGAGFPVGTAINVYGKKLSDVSTDAASGDMLATDYDADWAVKSAGGIKAYLDAALGVIENGAY